MGLRRAGGGTSGGSSGGGIREAGGRREGVSSCWRRAPSPRRGVPASSWRPPALGTRPLSPSRTSVDWALRAEPESPGLPPGAGSSPVRLRSERLPSRQGTGDPWGSSTPKASTTAGQERIREDGAQPLLQKLSKHSSRLHKLWHNNSPPHDGILGKIPSVCSPHHRGPPLRPGSGLPLAHWQLVRQAVEGVGRTRALTVGHGSLHSGPCPSGTAQAAALHQAPHGRGWVPQASPGPSSLALKGAGRGGALQGGLCKGQGGLEGGQPGSRPQPECELLARPWVCRAPSAQNFVSLLSSQVRSVHPQNAQRQTRGQPQLSQPEPQGCVPSPCPPVWELPASCAAACCCCRCRRALRGWRN